ncbi:Hypothetical predicted protein [Paramuricea clavata]|uniref:Uncharacterized protein n=1 Tax=Paramuricea clavata TaxID=317549 RepID=A0A6S7HLF9_PARCT|nr:Hypothetical predicted protein [Paramuricea clavata]
MTALGVDPRLTVGATEQAGTVINELENTKLAASDMIKNRLEERERRIQSQLQKTERSQFLKEARLAC